MDLLQAIHRFYYDMTLHELDMMSKNTHFPDITYNSLLYLDLIAYKENCTASYLADVLHISKSAVTVKVHELIKQGLVEKVQSPDDRRVYFLKMRPEAAEEYRKYDRKTLYAVEQMKTHHSEEELEQFCRLMETFSRYYREEHTQ